MEKTKVVPALGVDLRMISTISSAVWESRLDGGLVGEHHQGALDEGPRDGHPLLLPARKLARVAAFLACQSHRGDHIVRAGADVSVRELPFDEEEAARRLAHGQDGDEVVGLEHEADPFPAIGGEALFAERAQLLSVVDHAPLGGRVQTAEDVEQRRLARSRWADDGQELSAPMSRSTPSRRPTSLSPLR